MTLTPSELSRIRRLLSEIDSEVSGRNRRPVISTRTRNIRLVLSKAQRRENGKQDKQLNTQRDDTIHTRKHHRAEA